MTAPPRRPQRRAPTAAGARVPFEVMGEYRLLTARPFVQAQLLSGALTAEGLRVRVERDALGLIYGLSSGTFATRVMVAAEDFDRARAVLAEIETP